MELFLLALAVVISLGTALATAFGILHLVFSLMARLR